MVDICEWYAKELSVLDVGPTVTIAERSTKALYIWIALLEELSKTPLYRFRRRKHIKELLSQAKGVYRSLTIGVSTLDEPPELAS